MPAASARMLSDGFARPDELVPDDQLSVIVGEHAKLVVKRFLTTHAGHLDTRGSGLTDVLRAFVDAEASFAAGWDLSMGRIGMACRGATAPESEAAAAEFALHLHLTGTPGHWECNFESPPRLRLGAAVLPAAANIRVEAGPEFQLVVQTPEGTSERIRVSSPPTRHPQLLSAEAVVSPLFDDEFLDDDVSRPLDLVPPETSDAFDAALTLLEKNAPQYRAWVTQVIHHIVPLEPRGELQVSGSSDVRPGTVSMTARRRPAELADVMVHEASHQYAFILSRLGPLEDGTDARLYYSPLRDADRPIAGILVAYHALGNMLLATRLMIARGVSDLEYWERNERTIPGQLSILQGHLESTPALTDLGRLLFEPLRESLSRGSGN
jgi:HEXXH motif-containing protein